MLVKRPQESGAVSEDREVSRAGEGDETLGRCVDSVEVVLHAEAPRS